MAAADEMSRQLDLVGEEVTESLGERIGAVAESGLVLDLRGDLGAGKTALVRGLSRGLQVEGLVRSPTFTIASLHKGPLSLLHVDAYRLDDPSELALHGWSDWLIEGVIAVEWAEKVEEILPQRRLRIDLAHGGRNLRKAWIRATGPQAQDGVARAFEQAIVS
ncbi:MAG: tRNA (adenosine(37)-N6)-threonylcarbamoyltransferase complex ATPase subunit type 1 TsaE [Planctomycetota bacterium]